MMDDDKRGRETGKRKEDGNGRGEREETLRRLQHSGRAIKPFGREEG
jgi:hypothetical protein